MKAVCSPRVSFRRIRYSPCARVLQTNEHLTFLNSFQDSDESATAELTRFAALFPTCGSIRVGRRSQAQNGSVFHPSQMRRRSSFASFRR